MLRDYSQIASSALCPMTVIGLSVNSRNTLARIQEYFGKAKQRNEEDCILECRNILAR